MSVEGAVLQSGNPAVGVVVCTCGGRVNYDLEPFINTLSNVIAIKTVPDFCKRMVEVLKELREKGADRVLIVACSEKLSLGEKRLVKALEKAGFDPAMYEVANIREGCAWIHDGGAKGKAMDIVAMAHVKLLFNQPSYKAKSINRKVLVVGGGVAGLSCALALAKEGIAVTVVEKKHYIGGHLCMFPTVWQSAGYPSVCTPLCIAPVLAEEVLAEDKINIVTNAEIGEVKVENGNYVVEIVRKPMFVNPEKCVGCGKCAEVCPVEVPNPFNYGRTTRKAIDKDYPMARPDCYNIDIEACEKCGKCVDVCPMNAINLDAKEERIKESFGAVVIATGFEEEGECNVEGVDLNSDKVVTMMEFERLMALKRIPKRVAFVLCSKGDEKCYRFCCPNAVKLVARIKMVAPDKELFVIYNDLKLTERAFLTFKQRAEKNGVPFVKGKVEKMVESEDSVKLILNTGEEVEADLVVVPTPVSPVMEIAEKFGLLTDEKGYPIEFQPRNFNPGRTMRERIYVVGCAKGLRDIQESVESGRAVAKMILEDLRGEPKKFYALVSTELCKNCKTCANLCPHGAIICDNGKVTVDPSLCRGCGLCYGQCKNGGIMFVNLTEHQIMEMVRVAFRHLDPELPRILVLTCYWCSSIANDYMGINRMKLPESFRTIKVRCAGSVKPSTVKRIIDEGYADMVIVAGCPPINCHHAHGSSKEKEAIEKLNDERIRYEIIGAGDALKLANVISEAHKKLA